MKLARRALTSVAIAAAMHVVLVFALGKFEVDRWWEVKQRDPVRFEIVEVKPPPEVTPEPTPEPVPEPVPEPAPEPVPEPAPEPVLKPTPEPAAEPTPEPAPEPTPKATPRVVEPTPDPDAKDSPIRIKKPKSKLDGVMGLGAKDPFGTSLNDLSSALSFRATGPVSDKERAEGRALRNLQQDLSAGEVDRGLADDYLRVLRNTLESEWRPQKKELLDGGKDLDQLGMMKRTGASPEALAEMWKAYEKIAGQYARGEKLFIEPKRREKLRELFRTRNGLFRFNVALQLIVTQSPDGEVLTVETEIGSGHPGIDDGARDALVKAIKAMPEKPPIALHRGGPFKVRWRMRAQWKMTPPTSVLSGNTFDITRKGVQVDIPFEIKLTKRVLLLDFDNRSAKRD